MKDLNTLKLELIQKIQTLSLEELRLVSENIQGKRDNETAKRGIVEFTDKEINTMPKHIKKLLIIDKKRCRLRTRPSGKNSVTYEIRLRRDGYDISASGKTIELAKANFLSKCKTAQKPTTTETRTPTGFDSFARYYFDNFRKEKVSASTLKTDLTRYNKYLLSYFKNKPIKDITPSDCKKILDGVKTQGKGKTADELHSLMNVIFKSAIAHNVIDKNPLDVVLHIQHQRKNGKALTKEEEKTLKSALYGSQYLTAFMVMLYTGLRPNELKSARVDGVFIIAQNSKRKNKKIEYKKIPILKALKPYLTEEFIIPTEQTMRNALKPILPNHILYDLRTTFYTRCDEFGVSPVARDEFIGHSNGTLTNAYRSLSDEFLLKESRKLDKWT